MEFDGRSRSSSRSRGSRIADRGRGCRTQRQRIIGWHRLWRSPPIANRGAARYFIRAMLPSPTLGTRLLFGFGGLVTCDPRFAAVLAEAERAAQSDAGVLVRGETGTGKDLLARSLHRASARASGPFVVVDCAALPRETAPSELFGHARGAFSGAVRDRAGLFEAAHRGTVFLDRVDELDAPNQVRLLRVLQEREVSRLGCVETRPLDLRVVASTSNDQRRRLRDDLYWRLKVVEIDLVPLRERLCDVPLLAEAFLKEAACRAGKPVVGFSPRALAALLAHTWPGNVRELQTAVEAAVAAARGEEIAESDVPVAVRVHAERRRVPLDGGAGPEPNGPVLRSFQAQVAAFQRGLLLDALAKSAWRHDDAAQALGLERHQLKYLCSKLGIRRTWADEHCE